MIQLLDAQGREQEYANARLISDIEAVESSMATRDDVAPHIAKIPLRSECQALEQAADAYEDNARRHDAEAKRLRTLAKQAREQSENLKRMAGL